MLEERLNSQCTDRSSSKQWAEKLLGPPNFSVSFPLLIEEGFFQIWKELISWEREHRKAQWRPDLEVVVSSKFPGRALKESHPCLELCSTSSACFELLLLCGTILRTTRSLLHSEQVLDTADLSLAPVVSVKKKGGGGLLGFVITLKGVWKSWVQVALQASIKPIQVERWIEHAEQVNVRDRVEH